LTDDPKQPEVLDSKALKEERATKAAQAMSEYIAERNAERTKTARLRALRMAKEAADKAAKQTTPTKKRKSPT
jgi:hypothetical protein